MNVIIGNNELIITVLTNSSLPIPRSIVGLHEFINTYY